MKRCDRIGHIDFLEKVDNPSRLGRHAYEVTDTKLSRKAEPKHVIQLCFYSELLEHFQGTLPETTRIPGMHALTLQTLKNILPPTSTIMAIMKKPS